MKKRTPIATKDAALWAAVWACGAGMIYCSAQGRKRCRCGTPPNTDGIPCDTCQAIELRDLFKNVMSRCERAHDCDKKKAKRKKAVKP